MAFYTHDGIRHNTKQEALEHMEVHFVQETPPFEDAKYVALHNNNWGKYEIQSVPSGGDNMYLELVETLSDGTASYNLLRYSDFSSPEESNDIIPFLEKESKFLSMVGHEIKDKLGQLGADKLYFYDEEQSEVTLTYDIEYGYDGTSEGIKEVSYTIDGVFDGKVVLYDYVDPLEIIMNDILSHFIIEAEGAFKPNTGMVGYHKLDHILDSAFKTGRDLRVSLVSPS